MIEFLTDYFMAEQLTLDGAFKKRDEAMAKVEANAELRSHNFSERAQAFVIWYLRQHGKSPGEDITDACRKAGIVPHDDRAFWAGIHETKSRWIYKKGWILRS